MGGASLLATQFNVVCVNEMAKVHALCSYSIILLPASFLSFSLLGLDVNNQQRRVHSERLRTIYGHQHIHYGFFFAKTCLNESQHYFPGDFLFQLQSCQYSAHIGHWTLDIATLSGYYNQNELDRIILFINNICNPYVLNHQIINKSAPSVKCIKPFSISLSNKTKQIYGKHPLYYLATYNDILPQAVFMMYTLNNEIVFDS